jgi:peptidoglycan hydrolase CwlO-like protein
MPTKKNVNAIEPKHDIEAVPTEAIEDIPVTPYMPATTDTPVKKPKKNPSDTKALKKEINDLTTKLNEMSMKVDQLEQMLDCKQAELTKATKVIERLTQEYTRRTRFVLNTISQAHQAINMVLEDK